jgi:hypothetical protein
MFHSTYLHLHCLDHLKVLEIQLQHNRNISVLYLFIIERIVIKNFTLVLILLILLQAKELELMDVLFWEIMWIHQIIQEFIFQWKINCITK